MEKFLTFITDNPNIVVTVLSGFLLPIILVWLNNRYNLKAKKEELKLERVQKRKESREDFERSVYSSLSKILFDVQQLYVSLSGKCIDQDCIGTSLKKFDESVTQYHENISDNLLYMSSPVIDDIYRFYARISDLKIGLKDFNDSEDFEMAHVLVYFKSTELAEILIDIQDRLVGKRSELKIQFDRTQQEMMKYCCGRKPPQDLIDKYNALKNELSLKPLQPGSIAKKDVVRKTTGKQY